MYPFAYAAGILVPVASLLGVVVALGLFVLVLLGLWWSWRHPLIGLGLIVAGMGFHSFVLMVLLRLGTPYALIRLFQGWKELLLALLTAIAVARIWHERQERRLGLLGATDWVAIGFAVLTVIYFLLPDSVLHSGASLAQRLVGFRILFLLPLLYFLGRRLGGTDEGERLTMVWLCLGAGAAVSSLGLLELCFIPTRTWLDWGVNLYTSFLGFSYPGPKGLPENFFLTLPDGTLVRRMVSTYISPLGIAYTGLLLFPLGVVLIDRYPGKRKWLAIAALTLVMIGLMLAVTRLALFATIGEAVLLYLLLRRWWIAAMIPALIVATFGVLVLYVSFGPAVDRSLTPVRRPVPAPLSNPALPSTTISSVETTPSLKPTLPPTSSPLPPSGQDTLFQDTSFLEHYQYLLMDLRVVWEHPLGLGTGASTIRYGQLAGTGESAVLSVFGDMGMIGGTLYLAFYLLAIRTGLRAYRLTPAASLEALLPVTTLIGGLALIPVTFTSDVWGDLSVTFLFWWAAGASATIATRLSKSTAAVVPAGNSGGTL